ncbi:MAG: transposase [Chitinophagaceae bacterium]|jgi:transposase|nr:transposase [Chitinophagaceae bacterium]MCO5291627.1 transposase [Chitinophagaceae bacterium]MCO5291837.1 transposase [Chitinophagaceae bacterium]MCO5291849.1 transposase [Chitinophagaceae bacterium]MCO5291972.1 transposase [Chitinophagaceae bacterium]
MFGLKPKTVHYWYKEEISDYRKDIAAGKWGEKKIQVIDKTSGEVTKEKPVPIAKAENFGSHMTIDEKQIGKKMYTIMTNAQSGKIALLAQTMKPEELKQVMEHYLPHVLEDVKSVSCDMSPSYKKLCKDIFPNTQLVIDKFHVIKHLLDALQQVRKQLKTQYINQETILVKSDTDEQQTHWSYIELLERSRYILFKMQDEWEEDELEIMQQLFYRFPILETAYRLTQKLRLWYQGKNIGKSMDKIEQELYNWCDEVNQSKIAAFRGVRKMIEKHQDDIVNYFKEGQTNAKAENMNGKIQRFLANNFGIKDRDFFMYRIAGYFA